MSKGSAAGQVPRAGNPYPEHSVASPASEAPAHSTEHLTPAALTGKAREQLF